MIRHLLYLVFLLSIISTSCQRETAPPPTVDKPLFDSIPVVVPVQPIINEASGIADSKANTGYLWVEEDSGNPTQLFLLKYNGTWQKKVFISGVTNRDWEDMTISGNNIYIGEIGDNNAAYTDYAFYTFPEPAMTVDTVRNVETIRFRYPDGAHDAEAFVVEPSTGAIYIITKRDAPSRIYKLTPPFSAFNVAEAVGQLPYNGVTSAALSPDAKELVVKTYTALYYYKVNAGEKIEAALQKTYSSLPYIIEPQGEAVCFRNDNSGYFTLSELGLSAKQQLYFYKRN